MAGSYEDLKKIFHEPNRLAILSELAGASEPLLFNQLKSSIGLTDGNLSRHLKSLEEAAVIKIQKRFVDAKPQTSVSMTKRGREEFLHYLGALESVLRDAARKAAAAEPQDAVGKQQRKRLLKQAALLGRA